MKRLFLSVMCFASIVAAISSCNTKSNMAPEPVSLAFNERLLNYNSDFTKQLKSSDRFNGHTLQQGMDPDRVKILGNADAAGARAWGGLWFHPIGAYGGLWVSFGMSYTACSWCPSIREVWRKMTESGRPLVINDVSGYESDIVNNSLNPFNFYGERHNRLLIDLATHNDPQLFNHDSLSEATLDFLINDSSVNLTYQERRDVISAVNAQIPLMQQYFPLGGTKDIAGYINNTASSTSIVGTGTSSILNYLTTTDLTWIDFTTYVIGIENMIISDSTLTAIDKTDYLAFVAILKYSYAFWTYADTLH